MNGFIGLVTRNFFCISSVNRELFHQKNFVDLNKLIIALMNFEFPSFKLLGGKYSDREYQGAEWNK